MHIAGTISRMGNLVRYKAFEDSARSHRLRVEHHRYVGADSTDESLARFPFRVRYCSTIFGPLGQVCWDWAGTQ